MAELPSRNRSTKPATGWLAGITVLDFSSLLPCPFATHLLAKFGARVLKIESPKRPDPARELGAGGSMYREINGNKELVWLDLKEKADRDKLYALVREAHGAIEGYRPDVRRRLGIDYETLAGLNPALVYCSVGGYDPKGPYRNRGGHDINFVARSGILDQTRDSDGRCVMPGLPVGDYIVAYAAALRITSALLAARNTGRGCHVELTIEEALLEVQAPFLAEIAGLGTAPNAGETLVTGKYPCYRLYELPGGTFALGALEAKFWEAFCVAIGKPGLTDQQYATGEKAHAAVSEVNEALRARPFAEWLSVFETVDCCIEPVLPVGQVVREWSRGRNGA